MNFFQQMEQLQATLRDVAPIMWTYYNNLLKQGFNPEQAFTLTVEMQKALMNPSAKK
ncbi:hypothetical protein M4D55_23290 [Metabacillus idriensis]|uniref:hypothetical protein n=1 Tax=Metabacillus idriensis TaxID=324768 RepID=UPI00203CB998|nr:hypothetical protein [Metabacillus idriensis]MCM3598687.1 hypothetical protein [Metabacillus idriensis]